MILYCIKKMCVIDLMILEVFFLFTGNWLILQV